MTLAKRERETHAHLPNTFFACCRSIVILESYETFFVAFSLLYNIVASSGKKTRHSKEE